MIRRTLRVACVGVVLIAGAGVAPGTAAPADFSVRPGELIVDHPTLINLGFEWLIDGDANRNASVAVTFRKVGDSAWTTALPLMRVQGERIAQPNVWNLVPPNMFAGSVLDLEPGTAYEARFVLTDPDGVTGPAADATKVVTVRTRPEPMPAAGGKVYHVYPLSWTGPKEQPNFEGIMCAYNYHCGAGDASPAGRPRVRPGDTVLVHAGVYAWHYEFYGNDRRVNTTTTYEGTHYLTADGTAEKPIVIRGAGDGEVVLDGRGNFNLFNTKAADYNYFEDITFRNTGIAIWAGTQFIAGSKGLTVKHCRFEQVGLGVFTNYSGSSDFYIADSTFLGKNDSQKLIGWNGDFWRQFAGIEGQTFPPVMASYTAIRLYGPGHVVAFNYIADFHDGIDIETYGNPDGSSAVEGPDYPPREYWDLRPVAIDFYNNYLTNFHDNAFEIDGGLHNIRVMRNVMMNSASHPMCNQPVGGGPAYWIRNVVYHAPGGSSRLTSGSAGVVFYNNTIVTETAAGSAANVHWRNNLMLGENAAPAIFNVTTNTAYSSSDYNGFRPNPGAASSFVWNSPAPPTLVGDGTRESLQLRQFPTLAAYSTATGQDQHSVSVDYDIFVNVPKLDAKDLRTVQRLHDFRTLDFRLKPQASAIDKGLALPGITDGFTGRAPDLGAFELGQPLPTYGPRR